MADLRRIAAVAALIICQAAQASALDIEPKQVQIESRIVEVNEQALYNDVKFSEGTVSAACVLKQRPGQSLLETSLIATGEGANFRTWELQDIRLILEGGEKAKHTASQPYYISKESAQSNLVTALFVAIAVQYASCARNAQASKGKACPLSQGEGEHQEEQGKFTKAIEDTAHTAALAALISQSKGEIKGRRVTFDVTNQEDKLSGAQVIARLVNTDPPRIATAGLQTNRVVKIPLLFMDREKNKEKEELLIQVTPAITHEEE